MFIMRERFSLNVQTKSSLSKPLKLTSKWQQWQLDAALLNKQLKKRQKSKFFIIILYNILS